MCGPIPLGLLGCLPRVHDNWPRQTDREQTNREQRRLAEKGDSKNILLSPEPSCPNPHFVTKLVRRNQYEITVTKLLVRGQFVAVSWLGSVSPSLEKNHKLVLYMRVGVKLLNFFIGGTTVWG